MRRRRLKPVPRQGFFIDVRTLAAALTSRSFDLAGLADFLKTENRKLKTEEHGQAVTANYLVYACQDVQVTWECYCALLEKFAEHDFRETHPHRIFSEASIGKAYFREMNIRPWREVQSDFPDYLTGIIESTYSGGRAEVREVTNGDLTIKQLTSGTIEVWKSGALFSPAKQPLLELAKKFDLPTTYTSGTLLNTRDLGKRVLNALEAKKT